MWIKEVVTVGFDPVKEYEAIKQFERDYDMRDWVKSESTVCIAYTHTKSMYVENNDDDDH